MEAGGRASGELTRLAQELEGGSVHILVVQVELRHHRLRLDFEGHREGMRGWRNCGEMRGVQANGLLGEKLRG